MRHLLICDLRCKGNTFFYNYKIFFYIFLTLNCQMSTVKCQLKRPFKPILGILNGEAGSLQGVANLIAGSPVFVLLGFKTDVK